VDQKVNVERRLIVASHERAERAASSSIGALARALNELVPDRDATPPGTLQHGVPHILLIHLDEFGTCCVGGQIDRDHGDTIMLPGVQVDKESVTSDRARRRFDISVSA
jgi:hypothetical protein